MPYKDPAARKAYQQAYNHTKKKRLGRRRHHQNHRANINASKQRSRAEHPETARARDRAYYWSHKEQRLAYGRWYRATHRIEACIAGAFYRKEHAARISFMNRRWRERHKTILRLKKREYHCAHRAEGQALRKAYRARKKGAPVCNFTAAQWRTMQILYAHCCAYCGRRAKGHLTQDHVIPLIKGGSHTWENIVPACHFCNRSKGTMGILSPVQHVLNLAI